jgi:FAD/FMN-containing dehydrogenase
VTGYCECVGSVAPLLGGGYGILQGYYGLLADNLVSARMILANGTAVDVSTDSHTDLFWAIRGAGHNFGIVTEYRYKVYDVPPDDMWLVYTFTYEGSKVEAVFEELNRFAKTTAHLPGIFHFSNFIRLPHIDTTGVRPPHCYCSTGLLTI